MDSKNRLAIAIAITCLIVVAIFASFGRSLFFVHIPSITLSDASSEEPPPPAPPDPRRPTSTGRWTSRPRPFRASWPPLIRPDSYYRELTVGDPLVGRLLLLLRPVLAGPGLVPHPSGFGLRRGAP